MRRLAFVLLLAGACGDNHKGDPARDDAGADASGPQELKHCLDSAETIARPPGNVLPCDLLPPGFGE
ncbi:MAG: hypothetical protein HOV81_20040 [Kofleriaceae bacterium]|nr:hypothetical protein [Kofleriaceae bacterium]